MSSDDRPFAEEVAASAQDDLRRQVSTALLGSAETIAEDSAAIFPYAGVETLESAYCGRLGHSLVEGLAAAVRDGRLDPRGRAIGELRALVGERTLAVEQLFTFVYLTERTALDELALTDDIGATSEPWPTVAQLVRRGSFDLLAAFVASSQQEGEATITDRLTTLYTRPLFDAVFVREIDRAGRFGYPFALILFDVDRLSAINEAHGYGVGDRILERLGILLRQYFRQLDWVARHSDDGIAVLLIRTDAEHARELAERARTTIAERMGFTDHLTDAQVAVTVSVVVVDVPGVVNAVIDPERLLAEAETAMDRAKRQGGNRLELVTITSPTRIPPRS